jgi:tetratricopeptide (TPR) repeat protein
MLASNALDYDQALVHLRKTLASSRTLGARGLEGVVLIGMGRAARGIDVDARPAAAWFEDALQAFREVDEPVAIGATLNLLAEEQLKVGDLEGAESRAAEQSDLGAKLELLPIISESRRVLAIVAARRGQHADAERLLEEAAAAQEVILGQLAGFLTAAEHLAFIRGEYARALAPLRQALRLARDGASGELIVFTVDLAAYTLQRRGRAREAATLVGALETVYLRFPRLAEQSLWPLPPGVSQLASGSGFGRHALTVPAEFDEHRIAGRSLSLERAADLALRVLDEELAVAPTPAAGGSEAAP